MCFSTFLEDSKNNQIHPFLTLQFLPFLGSYPGARSSLPSPSLLRSFHLAGCSWSTFITGGESIPETILVLFALYTFSFSSFILLCPEGNFPSLTLWSFALIVPLSLHFPYHPPGRTKTALLLQAHWHWMPIVTYIFFQAWVCSIHA